MQRRITFVALAAAIVLCAGSSGAASVSVGDFEFAMDAAAFSDEAGKSFEEIYIRFPNREVRFKEKDKRFESRVRMTVLVVDREGGTVARNDEVLTFYARTPEEASDQLQFQTITKRFELAPGTYRVTCVAKDLNFPKVSIMGLIRRDYQTAVIEHFFMDVPATPLDKISLSDAKFLWELRRTGDDYTYHPNPTRMYGLYRDSLRVYLELYVPISMVDQKLELDSEIKNTKGETVSKSTLPLPKRTPAGSNPLIKYPIVIREDLNTFPAGPYTLYINAGETDQLLLRVRTGDFHVAWDLRTWESSRSTYLSEARFLMGDKEFEKFAGLSVGEQENALAAMWKKLDPNPATGVNEAYEEFLERMEVVKVRYSDYQLGIFTDRGLTYLRYGAPDELIIDVIPRNRESLSDAVEKVRDKYHAVNFSTSGARQGYADRPGDAVYDPRHVGAIGEGGNVGYPYELWVYNGGGRPILERDRSLEQDVGMRFLFIDRDGYGRYKLESTSTMIGK